MASRSNERDVLNKKIAASIAKHIELNKNSAYNGEDMLEDFVNGEIDLNEAFEIFVDGLEFTTRIVQERLELLKQLQSYLKADKDIDKTAADILKGGNEEKKG